MMNHIFQPIIVKSMKKNLDITIPHCNEHILPVQWHFIILRFHRVHLPMKMTTAQVFVNVSGKSSSQDYHYLDDRISL